MVVLVWLSLPRRVSLMLWAQLLLCWLVSACAFARLLWGVGRSCIWWLLEPVQSGMYGQLPGSLKREIEGVLVDVRWWGMPGRGGRTGPAIPGSLRSRPYLCIYRSGALLTNRCGGGREWRIELASEDRKFGIGLLSVCTLDVRGGLCLGLAEDCPTNFLLGSDRVLL